MTPPRRCIPAAVLLGAMFTATVGASDWTRPVDVTYEQKRCASYRARWDGRFLVVEAMLEPGWHTFAMDNTRRAEERLQGKKALGMDLPTEISVSSALRIAGPWRQSRPEDFSKPELRWFSWGFQGHAFFAVEARQAAAGPARVNIRGQVCTDTTCRKVDIRILLPLPDRRVKTGAPDFDPAALVQVR